MNRIIIATALATTVLVAGCASPQQSLSEEQIASLDVRQHAVLPPRAQSASAPSVMDERTRQFPVLPDRPEGAGPDPATLDGRQAPVLPAPNA